MFRGAIEGIYGLIGVSDRGVRVRVDEGGYIPIVQPD